MHEDEDSIYEVYTDNRSTAFGLVDPVSGEVNLPHLDNKEGTT